MASAHIAIGLVHQALETVPQLVELFLDSSWIINHDFGVGAPMYKANPTLSEMHKNTRDPRERLRQYLRLGLLDESLRVSVAETFARNFRQRFGQGERHDIFIASGEIFRIKGQLRNLRSMSDSGYAGIREAILASPHDAVILQREEPNPFLAGGIPDDPFAADSRSGSNQDDDSPYDIELKIFLDNPYNPWRRKDGAVHQFLQPKNWEHPVVTEIWSSPALAGYHLEFTKDLAHL